MINRVTGYNESLQYDPVTGVKFENNLLPAPAAGKRLARCKGGRVIDVPKGTPRYFDQYLQENNPPKIGEILHGIANEAVLDSGCEKNYTFQELPSLQINGIQVFQNKTAQPSKQQFQVEIDYAFRKAQIVHLPQSAQVQLAKLTSAGKLLTIFDSISQYLSKPNVFQKNINDDARNITCVDRKINFVPSNIKGVIDIILKATIFDEMDQSGQPRPTIEIGLKGFYNRSTGRFDFPLYWSKEMALKPNYVATSVIGGVEGLLSVIDCGMWLNLSLEEAKWQLTKELQAEYAALCNSVQKKSLENPNYIEQLYDIANDHAEYPWANDYTRGAQQLLINGKEAFQEGKETPTKAVFIQRLKAAFVKHESLTLSDKAFEQLTNLSCVESLNRVPGILSMSLLEHALFGMNNHVTTINFTPSDVDGVIDIIFQAGFYELESGYAVRAPGLSKIGTDYPGENEPVIRLTCRVKGFYDDKTSLFKFPIYWPEMGLNNSEMLVSANTSHKDYQQYVLLLENNIWSGHNPTDKKWYLDPALVPLYQKRFYENKLRLELANHPGNPKSQVLEYFAIGMGSEIPKRTAQQETMFTNLAAKFLTLGEKFCGKEKFKCNAINLQIQEKFLSSKDDDPLNVSTEIMSAENEAYHGIYKTIETQISQWNHETAEGSAAIQAILKAADDVREFGSEMQLETSIRNKLDNFTLLMFRLARVVYLSKDVIDIGSSLANLFYYDAPKHSLSVDIEIEDNLTIFNAICSEKKLPDLGRLVMSMIMLNGFGSTHYLTTFNSDVLYKRYRFSTPDELKIAKVMLSILESQGDENTVKTVFSAAKGLSFKSSKITKEWRIFCQRWLATEPNPNRGEPVQSLDAKSNFNRTQPVNRSNACRENFYGDDLTNKSLPTRRTTDSHLGKKMNAIEKNPRQSSWWSRKEKPAIF